MKLVYRLSLRISLALLALLAAWAVLFYVVLADELNDEMDDTLEEYAEQIITRRLSDTTLPDSGHREMNYSIREISGPYAEKYRKKRYADNAVHYPGIGEEVPSRTLRTVFRDRDDRYFELSLSMPSVEKDDLQKTMLDGIVVLYAALLLTLTLICVWVVQRSLRPLYALLRWLDGHKPGQGAAAPPETTSVTEFRRLNEAVARYIRRSEEAFGQQKQFIGNASHEMQTPLAVCRNRLEMLADGDALTESQLREIALTLRTLDSAIRMNRTLLLLSKIDNGQFPDTCEIDVPQLLEKLLADYREIYASRHISVEIEERFPLRLGMDESLASVLFSNLLKNAYVHNRDRGTIRIGIDSARIVFRNTGRDEPLDASRIFRRFYQGEKKEGSTGLGLALADSVCRLYGFRLHYRFSDGEHCFEVEIP